MRGVAGGHGTISQTVARMRPRGEKGGLREGLQLFRNEAENPPAQAEREATGGCAVIPVLNEEEAIAGVLERIPRGAVDEIIVADGCSKDRTRKSLGNMAPGL